MRPLREVVGDNPEPKVRVSADVQKLIDAGLVDEEKAKKLLAEGKTPKLLLEG